jgi:hypothetical protein
MHRESRQEDRHHQDGDAFGDSVGGDHHDHHERAPFDFTVLLSALISGLVQFTPG